MIPFLVGTASAEEAKSVLWETQGHKWKFVLERTGKESARVSGFRDGSTKAEWTTTGDYRELLIEKDLLLLLESSSEGDLWKTLRAFAPETGHALIPFGRSAPPEGIPFKVWSSKELASTLLDIPALPAANGYPAKPRIYFGYLDHRNPAFPKTESQRIKGLVTFADSEKILAQFFVFSPPGTEKVEYPATLQVSDPTSPNLPVLQVNLGKKLTLTLNPRSLSGAHVPPDFEARLISQETFVARVKVEKCKCKTHIMSFADMEATDTPLTLKKGDTVGEECRGDTEGVGCLLPSASQETKEIICPRSCVATVWNPRKIDQVLDESQRKKADELRAEYAKELSSDVLKDLKRRFPDWIPLIEENPFSLDPGFYLAEEIELSGRKSSLSLVFFYENSARAVERHPSWGFWDRASGKHLYSALVPEMLKKDEWSRSGACFVRKGPEWKETLLYGRISSENDVGSWGTAYSLASLSSQGPIAEESQDSYYDQCGWTEKDRAKKKLVREIDGPANLRQSAKKDSPVTGECANGARALVNPNQHEKDWEYVYCGGKSGWTHRKNLR
jgi:hypothetical protein